MKWRLFKSRSNNKKTDEKSSSDDGMHAGMERIIRQEWLPVEKLCIGMYVSKLDIPWNESSFLFQGMEIKSEDDINSLKKQCQQVWVDYQTYQPQTESESELEADHEESSDKPETEVEVATVEQNQKAFADALEIHHQTTVIVDRLFENIAAGRSFNIAEIQESIGSSIDLIMESPDAAFWLTRLNESSNQLATHSINVSALSLILGHAFELPRTSLEELGMCSLMHDTGKTLLPNELLTKSDLDKTESEQLETHVNIGYNLAAESLSGMSSVSKSILHHHENYDGSGYPNGLAGNDIPLYSRIIAIANTYEHMITGTPDSEAISQFSAIDSLYKRTRKEFDEELVIKFIEVIGLYPAGTLVEMTNGEVGIVLASTRHKLLPRIILLLDKQKEATEQSVIDLSMLDEDSAGKQYQIKTSLPDGTFGVFLSDLKSVGLKLH